MRVTRFDRLGDVRLRATAHHLPSRSVSTAELFRGMDVNPDELDRLTGVLHRRMAAEGEATSDLALAAARKLLDRGPIDRLLLATMSPDHPSPGTAPLLQHALGLPSIPCLDVVAACAGFVYAIDTAARAVLTGDEGVLVLAAETRSRMLERAAPGVRCLFGDGAAAALVARGGPGLRLVASCLGSDGSGHADVRVEAGGSRRPTSRETVDEGLHTLRMTDGPMVFYRAIEGFVEVAEALCRGVGISPADLDLIVPHQANARILERVAKVLRLPMERFVVTVAETGNVGGASAGIALDRAWSEGRIPPGARVLLLAAGAGHLAAAALFQADG